MMRYFYGSYVPLPLLQISVCVANLHDFNPSYTLLLPDGSNCSGMWGLRSTILENCSHQQSWPLNPPPYSWSCFNDALQKGDNMATLRFNTCRALWESSNTTNSTGDDLTPKHIEIGDSHDMTCINGSDLTNLNLPNHLVQIAVAASSYEKVINEMNEPFSDWKPSITTKSPNGN
ncbi:hypothetical protein GE061_016302 [Apolygus lucorum]|uniref:Uncharacterized protein n=1 Tax=Apolygus lucorum TaxID=248454 RepID=A0A6A4JP30_APOLU|nr:hypothetical protein GE061_016302 [Apolygus lucorum]